MTRCPKCGLEHDRVDVVRWLWLFRDTKPKPPGKGVGILAMLAARMDAKTGCGWVTDPDLADLAGCADVGTVRAATRWGRDRLLLHRVSKGYRITDERTEKSHWLLTDPDRPTGNRLPHGKASQQGTGSLMAAEPTGDLSGANRGSEPHPTGDPSPSIAKPEKLNQEASSRRTARTGSRGEPAATHDDGDPGQPLTAIDPRPLLLGLDADNDEIDPIINLIAETTGRDPGEYLWAEIGEHGEERGRRIVQRARRKLGLPEPKSSWCRDPECDPQTRIRVTETDDGPKARKCPKCHPDAGRELR